MPSPTPASFVRKPAATACVLFALACTACSYGGPQRSVTYEDFGSDTRHSRTYPAPDTQTCEAARRALMSQGYVVQTANADLVTARKSFQPQKELHVEVDFRVVCTPESKSNERTIVFVTAQQDRYALRKSNNAASLGVAALGSLSLPLPASNDSLVKVGGETITVERFYERFFLLLERYLATYVEDGDAAVGAAAGQ